MSTDREEGDDALQQAGGTVNTFSPIEQQSGTVTPSLGELSAVPFDRSSAAQQRLDARRAELEEMRREAEAADLEHEKQIDAETLQVEAELKAPKARPSTIMFMPIITFS